MTNTQYMCYISILSTYIRFIILLRSSTHASVLGQTVYERVVFVY